MNNRTDDDFMFSEKTRQDPYADNSAFLARVFTAGKLLFMLLLIALNAAAFIYTAMNISTIGKNAAAASPADTLRSSLYLLAVCSAFFFVGALIAICGVAVKKRLPVFAPVFFIIGFAALAAICVWFIISCLPDAQKLRESISIFADSPDFFPYLLFLPYIILILLSVTGIILFISMLRTTAGKGLYGKGSGAFRLFMNISAVVAISVGGYISYVSDWRILPAAAFICPAAIMFFGYFLIGRYQKGLEAAERAINMGGVNLYMNDSSTSAIYYQSSYSSPDTSLPPEKIEK